jgi:hypothetical protein
VSNILFAWADHQAALFHLCANHPHCFKYSPLKSGFFGTTPYF